MERIEREMAALEAELKRTAEKIGKLEDDEARKVARAVAEGRTDAEIDRIHNAFGKELDKLYAVQRRLDGRLFDLQRRYNRTH